MAFPGPALPLWGLGLIAFAGAVAILGEFVRSVGARRLPLLRASDPIERGLLDLYLGGAVLYLIAAFPVPIFYPATVPVVLIAGAVGLVVLTVRRPDRFRTRAAIERVLAPLGRPAYLLTLLAALGLFAVEVAATSGVGSGNTFDSSLLSTYTSLLLAHHTLPLSLAPVASQGLAYPQATSVWLASAQSVFGLPPLRTSLLVTPLFLALAPLGAFVVGRRLGGSATLGLSFALVFALLATWTRGMVGGSNDFVFALPLVLLLVGWSVEWVRAGGPSLSAAIAFGGLAGYAAALNPVGPAWLLLTLPVMALLARPRFSGAPARWVSRWIVAVAASLVAVLPSLYVLATSPSSGGLGSSGRAGGSIVPTGETAAQFVGDVDPFLFRAQDELLSPFPLLRAELAVLLIAGVILLAIGRHRFALSPDLARFSLASGAVAVALLGTGLLAYAGDAPFVDLFRFTSAGELAILLFVLYTIVAGVPLAVALGEAAAARPTLPPSSDRGLRWRDPGRLALVSLVILVILLPGVAVTTTELPGQLHQEYATFSNLTQADVDFLEWAPHGLRPDPRVLVGPGSVAEFLPAYDPTVVLLYPMTVGFQSDHPSYWSVVEQLQNGSLNRTGWAELDSFQVDYVAITENNTALFLPLEAAPFLSANTTIAFHEGGVYVFALAGPILFGAPGGGTLRPT